MRYAPDTIIQEIRSEVKVTLRNPKTHPHTKGFFLIFFSIDSTLNLYKYFTPPQKRPLEFSIDHSDSYWPVLTTFLHIDRGGFNQLKPGMVSTAQPWFPYLK